MARITAFDYPLEPHIRRHEPFGYADYESYRDWLRDDFSFRCVSCLQREQWGTRRAAFHIDHLIPQAQAPDRAHDYTNLVYVCASCNSVKSDLVVPDPCRVGFGQWVKVLEDGTSKALDRTGEMLIDLLRLDDEDSTRFRRMIFETLRLIIDSGDHDTYVKWMGYPADMPDLSKKKPPGNRCPEGIEQSHFARKQSGELPETY